MRLNGPFEILYTVGARSFGENKKTRAPTAKIRLVNVS